MPAFHWIEFPTKKFVEIGSDPSYPVASVITAFVWDGQRVLLALRSESVSTFPNHWAGISGYLESDDPVAWALVEIAEECGLARTHLTLRRVGELLEVSDENLGRTFRVHPTLWSIAAAEGVRADWEASRFEWVDVDELIHRRRTPTVPRLYDAFDRVWPAWETEQALGANLQLSLAFLRNDRSMGAGTLARAAASEISKLVRLCPSDRWSDLRAWLTDAADQLRNVRTTMVPPRNLLADVRDAVQRASEPGLVIDSIDDFICESEKAESAVVKRAAAIIDAGARVMSISYSRTVSRILQTAGKLGRVYLCEWRPLLEGRKLAEELAINGIPVTLLTDAQAATFMPQVDLVLLGADAVLPDGSIVNKVGSVQLALAARHCGKRVLIVAEALKFVRDADEFRCQAESNPSAEVWRDAPGGVNVANVYFEIVPADLIDEIVSS